MEVSDTPTAWRRSKRSAGANNCVEIAERLSAVRDSKRPDAILAIDVTPLLALARTGRLDR